MTETMYIRFGALPASGQSWNDEAQDYEAGVSVYAAEWQSSDRDVICVTVPHESCWAGTVSRICERPVYIVTGDLLDERGGDGEVLMANCTATLHGPVEVVGYVVEED